MRLPRIENFVTHANTSTVIIRSVQDRCPRFVAQFSANIVRYRAIFYLTNRKNIIRCRLSPNTCSDVTQRQVVGRLWGPRGPAQFSGFHKFPSLSFPSRIKWKRFWPHVIESYTSPYRTIINSKQTSCLPSPPMNNFA